MDDIARYRKRVESERDEFDDWIRTARFSADVTDRPRIEVDTLSGLVDLATDTDERVIETSEETFYVHHDGHVYVIEPPTTPTTADPIGPEAG